MSSQAGVQLFLQRILAAKDDVVDRLVRGISRGTGHDFGSKNAFVQDANRALSELGYMLVRVSVEGTHYYSLKDLESAAYSADPAYGLPAEFYSQPEEEPTPFAASSHTAGCRAVDAHRLLDCHFGAAEVSVYMDAMSHVISEGGRPDPFPHPPPQARRSL
ncbi:D-alanyl-D-alanine carboxypeptidase [Babesia caballi]|uniref:D-alanyl-D-alanine carboxypeptidase n=1 Tax=Babesia caballi TaxID=5871 RepID=A0AAV4LNY7_BABCB|nr:D-alanyl-D-alanine carboxypeptidase [Babesia caballi]